MAVEMKQVFINGEEVTKEAIQFEFDRLVRFYSSHGMSKDDVRKNLDTLVKRAQEQAIGAKLLFERANQLDLPVKAEALDGKIAEIICQVGGRENFAKALAQQKMSEDDLRKQIEKGCRVDALVEQVCREVPDPTEAEIEAYYNANKGQFVASEQVLAQHILVKTEGMDEGDKTQALEKIKAIRARIMKASNAGAIGEKFSAEAAENSDCPSGAQGGSLGWFGRGAMVPEFDKAAFSMKVGEVSDIIETQFGYHIILKTDERAGGQQQFAEVAEKIRDLLRHEARGKAMSAFVEELKEKATIEYK